MFPTFAEIAGADISDQNLEGRSLIPLLGKEEVAWPDRKLFFHGGRWAKSGAPRNFGKGDPNPDNYQYQAICGALDEMALGRKGYPV